MQLVDGDNSSPLLNFVLGNMIGVSEIDVQSVELLPGASSALYGQMHLMVFYLNSKSPFTSPGITAYAKFGQTSQKQLVQTTMLITELEWHMHLVKASCKLTLHICAVRTGMLQIMMIRPLLEEIEM
jgi:hypothetical protein